MTLSGTLSRLSAFTTDPDAGNPAGVWVGDTLPDADTMQRIATEVGFSETAFVAPRTGFKRIVRYYSPEAEVPFCGHATIATGVLLGEESGEGSYTLSTCVGDISVQICSDGGIKTASLTSVEPKQKSAEKEFVNEALISLGWAWSDLNKTIPPIIAYAGAWHLVLAVSKKDRLDKLDYDYGQLKAIMLRGDITTLQLVWRESTDVFHSRNPFPVGGVVEDPATGAAAAALGGYLRDAGLITAPHTLTIFQGEAMGRPSLLTVDIAKTGGIVVTGTAVRI